MFLLQALAGFAAFIEFSAAFELAQRFLEVFALVLAPIVVIYAIVAYRGQYESRSMPVILFLAVTVSLASVFHYASGYLFCQPENTYARHYAFFEALARVLSMLALLWVLRGYVHSEISLMERGEWKPKALLRQQKKK